MKLNELNDWLLLVANVGVLIGLGLLVYEIRQNSDLVRAEIQMIRAEGKADRQIDLANNGVLQGISAKLEDAGFPDDPEAINVLTTEERLRMRVMYVAIFEVTAAWYFQCQNDLLAEETCDTVQRYQVLWLAPRARAMDVGLSGTPRSFIAEVQRILTEEGLTPPNDDGSWPE